MRKFNFPKDNLGKSIRKVFDFLRKKYIFLVKEAPLILFFIVSIVIDTLLLRIITVGNGLYFKPLLFDFAMAVFFGAVSFLFKTEKGRRKYILSFSVFTAILCIIHSMYYSYYDSFASISLLATSTFVVDVGDTVVEKVMSVTDFVYLWQPIFMFYVVHQLNKKNKIKNMNKTNRRNCLVSLVSFGASVLGIACISMNSIEWGRFVKMWNRESVVSSFGIYTYQVNDIVQSLEPKLNNLFGYDKALKNVSDYYGDKENVTDASNEYSDIFKGKNVLVIHAESLQTIAIDRSFEGEMVTPNLNRLASEGIYFDNFYSQVGVGTSSDAEFTFGTSLMPSNSGTVFVNYFDREYNTIQKMFKNNDYYVFSMHANTGDFWNRATMHDNMGYDDFYSKSSFEIDETIGLGLSDKSFFKQAVPMLEDIIKNKGKPFYGTLITLTNHTPWSDFEIIDEYDTTWTVDIDGEMVTRDYINGTTLGDYFRTLHYFDQAFGQFIDDLDESGILDDTVIVIYGDHDARISKKYYNMLYNYDPYTDSLKKEGDEGYVDYNEYKYQLDKNVPFIIWTKDGKYQEKNSNPAGMIDALPTLANMFGVGTNEYQLGHDLFSGYDDNTVVFTDGSYLTDKIYYDGQSGSIYSINGDAVDKEYIDRHSDYADKIMDVSNDIITYDLIKGMKSKNK